MFHRARLTVQYQRTTRYGACPTCTPVSEQSASEILFRFGLARAYGIREIDMFAFGSADTAQWALYWPHLEAYLHCGDDTMPAGSCWPYAFSRA